MQDREISGPDPREENLKYNKNVLSSIHNFLLFDNNFNIRSVVEQFRREINNKTYCNSNVSSVYLFA